MSAPGKRTLDVAVEGGALQVVRRGAGPPLMLLHGWALDHRMFQPQWEGLESDFDLILPDRRGFGRSTAPPDLGREVGDVLAILDALDIERVHLLGMSQGGRIALRCAAEHPERIKSLLLQGPGVDGITVDEPESERIPIDEYAALARTGQLDELRRRWHAHPIMSGDSLPPEARALVDELLSAWEARDLVARNPASYAHADAIEPSLRAFRKPVLVLTGERETTARKALATRLMNLLPNAREVVLPACGHLSNLAAPDAYNDAVRRFCLGVAGP